jgi:hypothetical protein
MTTLGRPEFKPTLAQRKQVELLIGCGMTQDNIARVIGICKHTLEKHFPDELATGPAKAHAHALGLLKASAEKGNVSAQKKLVEITAGPATGQAGAGQPMGKKQQLEQEAKTAGDGTPWGEYLSFGRQHQKEHAK